MRCPFCHHAELKVTDSREAPEINAIRRRRECQSCQRRFTTFETIELTIQVKKQDGRYEDFQQQKLISGMMSACSKTSISHEQVLALGAEIVGELMQRQSKEITTDEIGEIVMQYLQKLDPIAYIRFACVYRRFKDVDQIIEEIESVRAKESDQIN